MCGKLSGFNLTFWSLSWPWSWGNFGHNGTIFVPLHDLMFSYNVEIHSFCYLAVTLSKLFFIKYNLTAYLQWFNFQEFFAHCACARFVCTCMVLRTLSYHSEAQIAKTLGSTSLNHRSETKVSDRCLIDVNLRVFVIYVIVCGDSWKHY